MTFRPDATKLAMVPVANGSEGARILYDNVQLSLYKDSSVYQIDIRREGTLTTYRLVIPWSEIPGFTPAKGAGFGCNIVLGDSDKSAAFGKMVWGGGLKDDSADCGFVTLVP